MSRRSDKSVTMPSNKIDRNRCLAIPANTQAASKLFQGQTKLYFAGWTQKNVSKLLQDLHGILDNFHRLTRNNLPLELLVGLEARDNNRSIVELEPDSREIHVFLQAGPRLVLELAPLILGEGLYQLMTTGKAGRHSPVIFFSGETTELVDAATVAITNSYLRERKLNLDEESLHQMLSATTQLYGQNLARLKTIYQTLCGPCLPRDYLARSFNETIETTRRELTAIRVNPETRHIITTIGQLAMIHTLTKRIGLAEVALAARRVLTEEPGDHLVLIELMQMRAGRGDPAPPAQWMIELQRRTGKQSYGEIFNQLVMIFDHQYDSFEVVPGY